MSGVAAWWFKPHLVSLSNCIRPELLFRSMASPDCIVCYLTIDNFNTFPPQVLVYNIRLSFHPNIWDKISESSLSGARNTLIIACGFFLLLFLLLVATEILVGWLSAIRNWLIYSHNEHTGDRIASWAGASSAFFDVKLSFNDYLKLQIFCFTLRQNELISMAITPFDMSGNISFQI